jgi:rod shape-determining protein MreC
MRNLFILILRFKEMLIYFLLVGISIWCGVNFNHIQRVNWLHASNSVGGGVHRVTSDVNGYFLLKSQNNALSGSNSVLMAEIERLNQNNLLLSDSIYKLQSLSHKNQVQRDSTDTLKVTPVNLVQSFNSRFIPCRVVYNSVISSDNFITIDKGYVDGIKEGYGIVTERGILGKVVSTARHHSLVKSILHVRNTVSAQIKNSNELGSLIWDGVNPRYSYLNEIPRHVKVAKGDTVITTSYNSVYPHHHPIGKIVQVSVDEDQPFWKIKIELFERHSRLNHCFVYINNDFEERSALITKKDSIY